VKSRLCKEGDTIDIVQMIEELESIGSSATRVPGLRKRVMVDLDRLTKVTQDMESSIPADILEAKEILTQKDSIVNQAQLEARRIKEAAEQEALTMTTAAQHEHQSRVDETEIVKAAEAKTEDINQQARQEAQQITQDAQRRGFRLHEEAEDAATTRREGADQYARETLFELEERLAELLSQVRRGLDVLGLEVEAKAEAKIATETAAVA